MLVMSIDRAKQWLLTVSLLAVSSDSWYILFYPITLQGHWGTTDDFETTHVHHILLSAALAE